VHPGGDGGAGMVEGGHPGRGPGGGRTVADQFLGAPRPRPLVLRLAQSGTDVRRGAAHRHPGGGADLLLGRPLGDADRAHPGTRPGQAAGRAECAPGVDGRRRVDPRCRDRCRPQRSDRCLLPRGERQSLGDRDHRGRPDGDGRPAGARRARGAARPRPEGGHLPRCADRRRGAGVRPHPRRLALRLHDHHRAVPGVAARDGGALLVSPLGADHRRGGAEADVRPLQRGRADRRRAPAVPDRYPHRRNCRLRLHRLAAALPPARHDDHLHRLPRRARPDRAGVAVHPLV
ncbi:MAG: Undecaprenyl-diphosphatase, partial [uncultured Thermomicrobiales bacterium]